MRKIVMMNRISLDGYYGGINGEIDWFIRDPQVDNVAHEMMNPDTLLMGRLTYQMFERAWRPVLEDPNADKHALMLATELTQLNKVVFSQTLVEVTWDNSRLVEDNVVDGVKTLKQADGADIAMFGSGTIARPLMEEKLIDEYILIVTPVALGMGKSFFVEGKRQSLALIESRQFESGNMILRYRQA